MEKPLSRNDVAVFVDFENVYVSVREKFDATPNFELIMDRCEDYGRIVIARAYADWYRYPRVTSALFANGVEPMYVPTYYYDREVGRTGRPIKNSVDIHLCIDVMRTLYTQAHIDKFVLVTGDRDFIPLVNAIRQSGKEVIVIGIGGAASAHLAQSADEFLFYEQIADLKPPQQRQEQRSERRERQAERTERERSEGNGKAERREQQPERAAAPAERNVYDTLVDAIKLARQRGFVSNLGSLKVLMRELDSTFKESKVRDASGRPFSKFKEFVKEAERQGRVQIFTNGTVTEVFLPGEDPYRLSQFAEDLAAQRAEYELESELDLQASDSASPVEAVPALEEVEPEVDETLPAVEVTVPSVIEQAPSFIPEPAPAREEHATSAVAEERSRSSFSEREWETVLAAMSQFTEPVRFIEIFSTLRGLRNQELLDLSNTELKDLVKQAINRGILQRTGRGAKAYYRISSQYRREQVAQHATQQIELEGDIASPTATIPTIDAVATSTDLDVPTVAPEPTTAERSSRTGGRRRRRSRSKEAAAAQAAPEQTTEVSTELPSSNAEEVDVVAEQPGQASIDAGVPADAQTEQALEQPVAQPGTAPSKRSRRSRRKKPAVAPNTDSSGATVEPVIDSSHLDQTDRVEEADQPQAEMAAAASQEESRLEQVPLAEVSTQPQELEAPVQAGAGTEAELQDSTSSQAEEAVAEQTAAAPKKRRTRRKKSEQKPTIEHSEPSSEHQEFGS